MLNSIRLPSKGESLEITFARFKAALGETGFVTVRMLNTWPLRDCKCLPATLNAVRVSIAHFIAQQPEPVKAR